jgi:hypothetical protein
MKIENENVNWSGFTVLRRDDADVVAAQAQRRHPDQHAGDRGREDREHEDDQEVEVDAGQAGGRLADEERDARAVRGVSPEPGSEVRGDVRAYREEGHIPQVQQPGEAHHDVQAQRHDHVGSCQDQVVHCDARLAEEERQDGGEAQACGGEHASHSRLGLAHLAELRRRR